MTTWTAWLAAYPLADDATKLDVLREAIVEAARTAIANGDVTAQWVNKKLPGLGITEQFASESLYMLSAPVSGTLNLQVRARNRADAEAAFARNIAAARSHVVNEVTTTYAPVFTDGPEDIDPNVLPDDAPTTVQGTLDALYRAVKLGHISGPKICRDGANSLLADFGLGPLPPVKEYTVTRPAEVELTTKVTAYDEASAEQVATWRWDDRINGFKVAQTGDAGDFVVVEG
jgi:hypothetical protein